MSESFDDYLKKVKDQQAEVQKTYEWYLGEIRRLVKQEPQPNSIFTSQSSQVLTANNAKQQKEERKDRLPQDAQKELQQANTTIYTTSAVDGSMLGKMLFYRYDAKTKEKLPYWDMYPLAFFYKLDRNGALGLNMHYLPPVQRAQFMTALWTLANSTELDVNTKLQITYKVLQNSSKFYMYKPCIKRYLFPQLRSRISVINPNEWKRVLFLPLASWQKGTQDKVWQDSINMINKSNLGPH